jgi:hypothetical protein
MDSSSAHIRDPPDEWKSCVQIGDDAAALFVEGRDAKHLASFVVGAVTKFYINQSCFRGLAKGARYQVVKAILQVLTKPDVEAAALVEFEIEPALLRHCRGIVGSNVEKANGMYCYLDGAWKCP